MSLAGETQQQPQELWVNVTGKDGKVYKTIFNCTSIPRFEKEEPELAKKVMDAFTEWIKVAGNEQKLHWDSNNRDECGFKFTDGEWEYKLLEFTKKDGSGKFRTLGKRKISKSGYGSSSRPFTLLRTSSVQFVRKEELARIINDQTETDSYEITYLGKDEQGHEFMVEKKDVYIPQSVTAKTDGNSNNETKETTEEPQ